MKWQHHADRRKPHGASRYGSCRQRGTRHAQRLACSQLTHRHAPHIDAPRTLAEALPKVVDDEALSSVVLPPPPLAPPGLVAAENCTNGGDTHFLEGTAEQEVVLIDDLDDCAQW